MTGAIQLVDGLHLTATERRAIAHIIGHGAAFGRTARKRYWIKPDDTGAGSHRVTIAENEADSSGRMAERVTRYLIRFKPAKG